MDERSDRAKKLGCFVRAGSKQPTKRLRLGNNNVENDNDDNHPNTTTSTTT